jgi:hypothetical protein
MKNYTTGTEENVENLVETDKIEVEYKTEEGKK